MSDTKAVRNFEEFLNECIGSRLEDIDKEIRQTREYHEILDKEDELYSKIKSALSEELKEVLEEYSEFISEMILLHEGYYYRQGFKDGNQFLKLFENRHMVE